MAMKGRTVRRHIGDSFRSLRRNGWMSVAAVSAVTVTLLLVGVFLSLILNFNHLSQEVENDVRVRVLVNVKANHKQIDKLEAQLKKLDHVEKVTYSNKKQELDKVVGSYGSTFKMFSGDENPLNNVFIVSTSEPKYTIPVSKDAAKLSNVDKATYGGNNTKKLFKTVDSIQRWIVGITILLLFVAVFLISNTIRITILSRQNEIGIMRLVGATNGYIRWPFLLEGAWTGLLGAIIPIAVIDFVYLIAYRSINTSVTSSGYSILSPNTFLFQIDLVLALMGIIIGALGAVISMRRFLKI